MTISTAPTPLSYAGNGSTTAFTISWKYNAKSHVVATLRSSAGAETVWVLTTNYTLTDPGDTGTLTAVVAPATGTTLVITLEPPNTQSSDIPVGGDFPSVVVEDGLDLSAQRDAKVEALFLRSLRVPKTDTQTGSLLEIPIDSLRASKFLGFNSVGKPIAAAGTSANLGPVSAFIDTLLDDATSNAALTTLTATRSETGAVAAPILDITRRNINVHDFGAVGNGTTDDSTAIQNSINAAKAIPGGSVDFQPKAYNLGTTGITVTGTGVSGSGVVLNGQARRFVGSALFGTELLYSGTGNAVLFGQSGIINYNCGINKIQIRATGGAITSATAVGLNLINSHYFDSNQAAIKDFSSGVGLLFQPAGASMFGATTQWKALLIHLCKVGVQSIGIDAVVKDNHAIFFGGAIIGAVAAGTIGLDLRQYSDGYIFYGTDVETFETGIKCDGSSHRFIGSRTEFCTTAVNLTANSTKTGFIGHQFAGSTTYTDSGTLNYRIDDGGFFGKLPIRPSADAAQVLHLMRAAGTSVLDFKTSGTPTLQLANGAEVLVYSDGYVTQTFRIQASGALTLGPSGAAIARHLSGSVAWDPPSLAAGASTTTTVTVTGATTGGNVPTVAVGWGASLQGLTMTGYVSAANTVTVVLFNGTAGAVDLAAGNARADVWEH